LTVNKYHFCNDCESKIYGDWGHASSNAFANSLKSRNLHLANASFPSRFFGTPFPSMQVTESGRSIHTEDNPSARAGTWSCGSDCATTRNLFSLECGVVGAQLHHRILEVAGVRPALTSIRSVSGRCQRPAPRGERTHGASKA